MNALRDTLGMRELLQYVPQFANKIFVIDLAWSGLNDSQKSEIMLDLSCLQGIGVKLVLCVESAFLTDIANWAMDFEFKLANGVHDEVAAVYSILERGQAALIEKEETLFADLETQCLVMQLAPEKVLSLLSWGADFAGISGGSFFSLAQWKKTPLLPRSYSDFFQLLIDGGVPRVHLLDAQRGGVLLSELFSNEGCGLMVHRDSYRKIRPLQKDDIPEVLAMIGRSVRRSKLVPRLYEDIESRLEDYSVYELDGNVIGCVALHHYPCKKAEVACLYVKQGHGGRGYGKELVLHAQKNAKLTDCVGVFAITMGAAAFFEDLDYVEMPLRELPPSRYQQLKQSGRDSRAFLLRF